MNVSFLEFMDKLYEEVRATNNIQVDNEDFRHYENLIPIDFTTANEFLCLKVKKTKILFCQSSVKVYLSDADIVSTIIKFDTDTVNFFLQKFTNLYSGKSYKFRYRVNSQEFDGIGLEYINSDFNFLLQCDREISVNEFIFILNMVFEKDRLFSEVAGKNLVKITLSKFILLIRFYRFNDSKCRSFLLEIGYPVDEGLNSVFASAKKTEMINKKFESLGLFEKSGII